MLYWLTREGEGKDAVDPNPVVGKGGWGGCKFCPSTKQTNASAKPLTQPATHPAQMPTKPRVAELERTQTKLATNMAHISATTQPPPFRLSLPLPPLSIHTHLLVPRHGCSVVVLIVVVVVVVVVGLCR